MTAIIEAPEREVTAIAAGPAANSPMGMMMAAVKQGIPLDQIKEMMAIQRDWEADEARKAFNDSLAAFKAEAVEVLKRREVDFTSQKGRTNYKHAELSDVVEAVGPALSKHGFAWSWKIDQEKDTIRVTCILKHRLGHSDSVTLSATADTSGNKNSIQAIASTVTYLQRHTLKAITGVSEKGEDNDGRGDDKAGQVAELRDYWISEMAMADTSEHAIDVWEKGCVEIQKTNDLAAFAAFKKAYTDKRNMLKGAA
ncbi:MULTISPECIES: ERF family protein [unclassified Achromobacter]|uniref:ERF family protein n=1 Tax=unclassified Achromobacter TaxID=2626865 RepID=UPI000B51B979|nr:MULTISPECIES: ERF family protein [unclassified Achromobacter]OWT69239.1 single-stranded DNA-binding protein [Achromobacter sp. HZ34]OWT70644.1 single-stranded DNA-binding protein [Achromobacter sp. HZ28]